MTKSALIVAAALNTLKEIFTSNRLVREYDNFASVLLTLFHLGIDSQSDCCRYNTAQKEQEIHFPAHG